MGGRDFRKREAKKPKKDAKKTASLTSVLPTEQPVEVIKAKGKKAPPPEE
ncbi:MAG: hypothetical protein HY671_06550 [Chloroflexi bacterium]|nr:hypothetical protein [Chloroflexota bacterium]